MKKEMLMEQELMILANAGDRNLQGQIERLTLLAPEVPAVSSSPDIVNLADNTDWNWSTDAFLNAGITPGTAGDLNNRAYNWYRMQRATALLVEDDANSLKGPLHSLFAGETDDTPRWSKTDGWAELGETGATPWDICSPLPNNFVTPGMRFYIQMIARLRTGTVSPGALKFFWALCDNTNSAPAPQIIKGSALPLDGATYGPTGATTRDYKLIVTTDYGNQVESTVKSVTNTPVTLSPTNGVALSWPRYPGFTQVEIYVTEGGATFLVYIIGNGASAFNDVGQRLGPVAAIPSVTDTQAKAYSETREFTPTTDWTPWDFTVIVPQTYNFSLTTGKQWLRGGVIGLMGDPHQLQIDRLGVATGYGVWSPSARDRNAASLPSTTQTSSTQGPPAGGGEPPGDGDGGLRCSTLDTEVDVCDRDGGNERKVLLGEIEQQNVPDGIYLVGKTGRPNRIRKVSIGWSDLIVTIKTRNGAGRRCSPSDLWLTVNGPSSGIAARRLSEGMEVFTRKDGVIAPSEIMLYSLSTKGEEVRILETDGDHTYWAGDAGCHNMKAHELLLT